MSSDAVTAAFGPDSVEKGALLPPAAREVILRSFGFPPGVREATADGWVTPEIPVLVRGSLKILPLARWGADGRRYNPYAEAGEIDAFARRVLDAGMYANGPWQQIDLSARPADSVGSYAAALRSAGASRADGFIVVPDRLGLAVVWAGEASAGSRSLAVHVVPEGWVSARAAGAPVAGIDARWSWADVVALRGSRDSATQTEEIED